MWVRVVTCYNIEMDISEEEKFRRRSEGGIFQISNEEGDNMSAMISMDDEMLIVSRKGVHTFATEDSIDPNRTNSNVRRQKQTILPYGSDDPLIGRTLQQAEVLLGKNSPMQAKIDSMEAIRIALSFIQEMASLRNISREYSELEELKNSQIKIDSDGALSLPSISDVKQQAKKFILGANHASRSIMDLAKLFYPDLRNDESKKWNVDLYERIYKERGKSDQATVFMGQLSLKMWQLRDIRNAIEHEKEDDKVIIRNYTQTAESKVRPPSIQYLNSKMPLNEMGLSQFMLETVEDLIIAFEMLMVHMCNNSSGNGHSPGDIIMGVTEVPEETRGDHEKHVGFRYAMFKAT